MLTVFHAPVFLRPTQEGEMSADGELADRPATLGGVLLCPAFGVKCAFYLSVVCCSVCLPACPP